MKRVIVNAIDIVGTPMSAIIHDLAENEVVCLKCKGVGMHKTVYKTPDKKYYDGVWNVCIPWHNQYLTICTDCNVGKSELCKHCNIASRSSYNCDCVGASEFRSIKEDEKEEERRKKCARIKLSEYDREMIYVSDTDEYVDTDDIEDYLESNEIESAVLFACVSSDVKCLPSACDIINDMKEEASEQVEGGVDMIDFTEDAQSALEQTISEWSKRHVTFRQIYFSDLNLIVEMEEPNQ
jgi:hypothetical protein